MAIAMFTSRWRESTTAGYPVWEVRIDPLTGKGRAYVVINSAGRVVSTPTLSRYTALQIDTASLAAFRKRADGFFGNNFDFTGITFNTGQTLDALLANSV